MFDEFIDVVEVLSGEFSPVFEACGWLCLSEDVHGHVFDPSHVFGAVAGPQAGEVVMEDHIEGPSAGGSRCASGRTPRAKVLASSGADSR